jgi:hypothetical protein
MVITEMKNTCSTQHTKSNNSKSNSNLFSTFNTTIHHTTPHNITGVVDECRVLEKEVFKRWKSTLLPPTRPASPHPSNLIDLDFLSELLKEKSDYLVPYNHYRLLSLCADKVVIIYLYLLKDARASGRVFLLDGLEIDQLNTDINAIQSCFRTACKRKDLENYSDAVLTRFRPLRHAITLLSQSRSSSEFEKTLDTLYKVRYVYVHWVWDVILWGCVVYISVCIFVWGVCGVCVGGWVACG